MALDAQYRGGPKWEHGHRLFHLRRDAGTFHSLCRQAGFRSVEWSRPGRSCHDFGRRPPDPFHRTLGRLQHDHNRSLRRHHFLAHERVLPGHQQRQLVYAHRHVPIPRRDTNTHTYSNTDSYPYADTDAHSDGHSDSDRNCHTNRYFHAHSDANGHTHSDGHADSNSNSYAYTDGYGYTNGHSDSDRERYRDSHSQPDAYSNSDANGHSHCDGDSDSNRHANGHSDGDAHPDGDRYTQCDSDGYTDAYTYGNANNHTYAYAHPHANSDAQAYAHTTATPDTGAAADSIGWAYHEASRVASGNKEKVADGEYLSVTSVGERVRLARSFRRPAEKVPICVREARALPRESRAPFLAWRKTEASNAQRLKMSALIFFENFAARFPEKE
jgi:hypothetical protein